MSAPVDVRAVMSRYWRQMDLPEDLYLAIAAVDELIDQIDRVASGLEADGRMPDAMTKAVAARRLRAALARVGGVK